MLKAYHLFAILIIGMLSCNSPEYKAPIEPIYFDLKAIVKIQIDKLNKIKPEVSKKAMLNNTANKIDIKIISWEKELKIFENVDINKPIFRGMYRLVSSISDTSIIEYYSKIETTKSEIVYLKFEYSITKKLKIIEALQRTSNPVFDSENKYLLNFDTTSNLLKSYQLAGWQGFRFCKKDSFLVNSKLKY